MEGVDCHRTSKPACLRDRGKRLPKLETIAHECWTVLHTWGRTAIVDEIGGTAEEFCQFAGAPQ